MQDDAARVKERVDLAELIGEYVTLKQAGRHFKALCPFHQEKTPSFIVSPDKGIWHCFGCNVGGDALSFIQKREGVEFPEALRILADRVGITLTAQRLESRSRRARLYDVLAAAARFYHEVLVRQPVGARARGYVRERGLTAETVAAFSIGYAPRTWRALQNAAQRHGLKPEELEAAGLIVRSARGKLIDRFRGRIMFPIRDVQGRVVAFGGRIVPWYETGTEGKYVNSPETEVYEKRRTVYNLDRAKRVLRPGVPAVIVEGYMDAVLMAQCGVETVVASAGTAFTAEHIQLLKRYTDVVHFAFDADAAGLKATLAATREALAAGLRVAMVVFPAGTDPAEVASREPQAVAAYLHQPQSLVSVLLKRLHASDQGSDRETLVRDLLPLVATAANPVIQGELVQELAGTLHVPEPVVLDELRRLAGRRGRSVVGGVADTADASLETDTPTFSLEHYLLGLLLAAPAVRQAILSRLDALYFAVPELRALFTRVVAAVAAEPALLTEPASVLVERLQEERTVVLAQAVLAETESRLPSIAQPLVVEGEQLWRRLKQRFLKARLQALQVEMQFAPSGSASLKPGAKVGLPPDLSAGAVAEAEAWAKGSPEKSPGDLGGGSRQRQLEEFRDITRELAALAALE